MDVEEGKATEKRWCQNPVIHSPLHKAKFQHTFAEELTKQFTSEAFKLVAIEFYGKRLTGKAHSKCKYLLVIYS